MCMALCGRVEMLKQGIIKQFGVNFSRIKYILCIFADVISLYR